MSDRRTPPTPTMEEEIPTFQPISPVIQTAPPTPQPIDTRQQVPKYILSPQPYLPNPMPAFQVISPYTGLSQTPRAFLRPTTAYHVRGQTVASIPHPVRSETVPIPVRTTIHTPALQPQVTDTPPLLTPYTVLQATTDQVTNPACHELPAVLTEYHIGAHTDTIPPPHNPEIHTPSPTAEVTPCHTVPRQTQFDAPEGHPQYQPPFRSFIPSTNTVSSLKRQLNKLEAENYKLRMENDRKYAECNR